MLTLLGLSETSTAYVHGLTHCTGDFVIIMDADFSHHVSRATRQKENDPSWKDSNILFPFTTFRHQPKFIPQFIK